MSNIKAFPGCTVPDDKPEGPDPAVIEFLEEVLTMAKENGLRNLALTGVTHDGKVLRGTVGLVDNVYEFVGMVNILARSIELSYTEC